MPKVEIVKRPDGKALKKKQERLNFSSKSKVKVGFPEGGGEYPDGTPVVTVAVWNEFGIETDTHTQYERPFFRLAMLDNRAKYRKMNKSFAKKILDGKITIEQALGLLGEEAVADIIDSINELSDPANEPSTIAKKGSSNPLVDTKLMGQSVRAEVVK